MSLRQLLSATALLALAAGCTSPIDAPLADPDQVALLFEGDQHARIELRDLEGVLEARIELPAVQGVRSLSRNRVGQFIVHDYEGNVWAVDETGEAQLHNREQVSSGYSAIVVDEEDEVVVPQEYEATALDGDGEVKTVLPHDSTYCWMDAAPGRSGEQPVMLDVYGPALYRWDTAANQLQRLATVGWGHHMARDGGGNFYVSGDASVSIVRPGQRSGIQHRLDFAPSTMTSAGRDAVFAFSSNGYGYDREPGYGDGGQSGVQMARISVDGSVEQLAELDSSGYLVDAISF